MCFIPFGKWMSCPQELRSSVWRFWREVVLSGSVLISEPDTSRYLRCFKSQIDFGMARIFLKLKARCFRPGIFPHPFPYCSFLTRSERSDRTLRTSEDEAIDLL
ncbi:hypothetical protein NC652_038661 [Populus alba x Populus x berolinensis]|nr:hypothetical protein NC652_038661 [Populus alba x Populus x berolinensis]